MAAVPKTKTSRARRDSRRAQSFKLSLPSLVECPQCKMMKRSHRACTSCGYYAKREVFKTEAV